MGGNTYSLVGTGEVSARVGRAGPASRIDSYMSIIFGRVWRRRSLGSWPL
jgi:hypothetical protein